MKDLIRRDALITILGLLIVSVIFLFLIYLPGRKSIAQMQREIGRAEKTIQEIPQRISELEALQKELGQRQAYLEQTDDLLPQETDWHRVVHKVADLAGNSELTVNRLEPVQATQHETYRTLPFRLNFSGEFRGVTTFLKGLESCDRLFHIHEISLNTEDAPQPGLVVGDMRFSAYNRKAKFNDSRGDSGKSKR